MQSRRLGVSRVTGDGLPSQALAIAQRTTRLSSAVVDLATQVAIEYGLKR